MIFKNKHKKILFCCILICLSFAAIFIINQEHNTNVITIDTQNKITIADTNVKGLYVPTEIRKINNKYFIVDCFHNRIIYSNDVELDYDKWNVIDFPFTKPHSIAGDDDTYVAVDTDANSIVVFDKDLNVKQRLYNVGSKPHHVIYYNSKFYVLMSTTNIEICIYKKDESTGMIKLESRNKLDYINSTSDNAYVRSMSIIDGFLYLPCATNGHVYKVSMNDFSLVEDYTINTEYGGFNFITKIDSTWFITSTGGTDYSHNPALLRTTDLATKPTIDTSIEFSGTPYYIEYFDDKYWIPEIYYGNSVRSFKYIDNDIRNITKYEETNIKE